jgi:hypothetical protein
MDSKRMIHRPYKNLFKLLLKQEIALLLFFVFLLAPKILFSQQAPKIQWQKSLGGTGYEVANCIIQTFDGGYAVAAYATSADGDVSGNHGSGDAWIIKLDSSGNLSWKKCFGGTGDDYANWIIQTSDGGYVFAGRTGSSDGDVSGNHGGDFDGWVVKLNSSGTILWQKCLGGTGYDQVNCILRSSDGGYTLCGVSYSHDGDVTGNHSGPGDAWIVKLDSIGNILWQKCVGGTGNDEAISIIQNSKGGYAVAGRTSSSDGDISGYHGGDFDAFVFTVDSIGNLKWMKVYGGDSLEHFHSIVQTPDHGYIVAGHTMSNNGDVSGSHGDMEAWVVKIDSVGSMQWQKCLGGSGDDGTYAIKAESDGYVAAGWSGSEDGDVSGGHGADDIWIAKLNSQGKVLWQKCLGGSQPENANSMVRTSDGGYIIAGFTNSSDGDVTGYHGGEDTWIVKLGAESSVSLPASSSHFFDPFPNPAVEYENISYLLDKRSPVKIEIFTPLGEKIKTLADNIEDEGLHDMQFNIHSFPAGSYFIRLSIDGITSVKVLQLVK